MASSFRGASYTKPSYGVFRTLSYIKDGAFAKKVKVFLQKTRCSTEVLPPKSMKMQLSNKLFEILHKFVSFIFFFFKIVVLKAASYSRPISNFKYLQQRSFFKSSCSQIFFKIGIPKNFANFTGKPLCWSLFLINSQALGLQLY